MTPVHRSLPSEQDASHAAEERRQGVLREFVKSISTRNISVLCTHGTGDFRRHNKLLLDVVSNDENAGGLRIRFKENNYMLSFNVYTSEEERGDHPSCLLIGDDIIEEVTITSSPPLMPRSSSSYFPNSHYYRLFCLEGA